MATFLEPPATAALDTRFEVDCPDTIMSPTATRYIKPRPRDGFRFARAASEPINVSYHPELYDKLNTLWQHAITLSSSHPQHPIQTASPMTGEEASPQSEDAEHLQPLESIVDWEVFQMLYSTQVSLDHFTSTKQELPFIETIKDKDFMDWVAAKEPGVKINYGEIRTQLARLSREPILRQKSPNVFSFFDNLLRARDMCILRGARFFSYDLWMNMVEAYYGNPSDTGLLSRFPITEPVLFQEYVAISIEAMSDESRSNRKRNWTETYDQWREAEASLVNLKTSREFFRRYDQLQKLMKIFRNRFEDRTKRHRALRTAQSNRKVDKRSAKAANIDAWREQVTQGGWHELDESQIEMLHSQMEERSQCIDIDQQSDGSTALPTQLESMKIATFSPDASPIALPQKFHLMTTGLLMQS